ncbi:MAG: adenylate/guanylate cyclase domain-containing protein [Pseudomonadota bacterium]
MEQKAVNDLLLYLIKLAGEISRGHYDNSKEIFEFTKAGQYPDRITDLAEAFGMMMVQVEAREFRLEQMIEDLNSKNKQLEESLQKVKLLENIKSHLGKFVPESVRRIIEDSPEAPDLEKHIEDVTVLFLDVAGYTRMSETVDPDKMNYLIERYFSSFLDHIHQNKGDINETAGDGLMIIFKAGDNFQHAVNAAKTAMAIQEKVQVINRDLKDRYAPITINIGINSGEASVGSTCFEGVSGTRWTYTASGPVTNIAARIGSLARNGQILLGEETANRVRDSFPMEEIGKRELKNVKEPIRIYRIHL